VDVVHVSPRLGVLQLRLSRGENARVRQFRSRLETSLTSWPHNCIR
jgi:hypothetical protein